jgi:hypothetical protein
MRRGAVFYILQNRLYLGETVHKGQAHPGQHEAMSRLRFSTPWPPSSPNRRPGDGPIR